MVLQSGRSLRVSADEPDLIAAPRRPGVVVHGHHVAVSAEEVSGVQKLPEEADLPAHRLLGGRPEERPAPIREQLVSTPDERRRAGPNGSLPGHHSDWLSVDDTDVGVRGTWWVALELCGQVERRLHGFIERPALIQHLNGADHR